MNIYIFLGGTFLIIFLLGYLLEKIKIPWIFAALFLGLLLSLSPATTELKESSVFLFLANLGMYFLLFLIGYELNLNKIKQLGSFIVRATFFIIFFEAIFGSFLIHFVFGYSWLVSLIVGLSFATVGEAVLIPILEEFKLSKTKIGQTILGIGTFDDLIEIFLVLMVALFLPFLKNDHTIDFAAIKSQTLHLLAGLSTLILFSMAIIKLRKDKQFFNFLKIEEAFFLVIAIFFIFLGVANWSGEGLGALGAISAGMILGNFLPLEKKNFIEKEIKALAFGFFGPIFFLWVGIETDLKYILSAPLLVLLVIVVSYSAKILASYLIARKELGTRPALVMGMALGVRFSTSIVLLKILYENTIIDLNLYSVLIGSTVAFKFIIPFLLAYLIQKWKIAPRFSFRKK